MIREPDLGLIAEYGDDRMTLEIIEDAIHREWPCPGAIAYVAKHHTWGNPAEAPSTITERHR